MEIKSIFLNPKNIELKAIRKHIGSFAEENDQIAFCKKEGTVQYFRFELGKWKHMKSNHGRIYNLFSDEELRFIILKKADDYSENSSPVWIEIASGIYWKVLENVKKCSPPLPFRFGLSDDEKKLILSASRKAITQFLEEGEIISQDKLTLPQRFYYRTDLDVTIWVKGQLRGSSIVKGKRLSDGIVEASLNAIHDFRFKPISKKELSVARIEIIIFLNDRLILNHEFIRENKILPDKGYFLSLGNKSGWFLPEVFNVRRFSDSREFLRDLASEKAGLPKNSYLSRKTKIEIFSIIDFIEGEKQESNFDLWGPVLLPKKDNIKEENIFSEDDFERRLRKAGDWLLEMQEEDGNFVPIINPLNGFTTQIDWPRATLSAWSLTELSKSIGENKYLEAAEKYFYFFKKYLQDRNYLFSNRLLVLAYAGEIALSLSEKDEKYIKEAENLAQSILTSFQNMPKTDPITIEQSLSFLSAWIIFQKSKEVIIAEDLSETIKELTDYLKKEFELKSAKQDCNLAVWAELVHSLSDLFSISGNSSDQEFIFKLTDWLINFQNNDGSFAGTNNDSNFVYTRGTAKIFEVLPDAIKRAIEAGEELRIKKYKKTAGSCLTWLELMQYDENNVFFVRPDLREEIIGGFRHDYMNQEAWIDAAAHFILGGTRILKLQSNGKRK